MTADPRALQLAESRYRNGYGPTGAEAWDQLDASLRGFLVNEAASWMQAAVAAGIALPTTEDLAGSDGAPRRTLTPGEYDAAWHAVEGSAGEEGADPGTVLHAVLDRLGIQWQDATQRIA